MSKTIKFHIVSSVSNLLIIILAAKINVFIIDIIDPMIFVKRGGSFDFIWIIYLFGLFWSFTFIIYLIKKQSLHVFLFLGIGFVLTFIKVLSDFYYTESDFFLYLKNGFLENIIFIILTSIGIHFCQLILGKRLLEKYYFLD